MAVLAEICTEKSADEQRATHRHTLRLEAQATAGEGTARVLIHNVSETGMLLETVAELEIGDTIVIDLPEAPGTSARIQWASGSFYGCQFNEILRRPAVSAARLASPYEQAEPEEMQLPWSELITAFNPDVQDAADSDEFSPRAKFAIIVGSSLFLWSVILAAAWAVWQSLA